MVRDELDNDDDLPMESLIEVAEDVLAWQASKNRGNRRTLKLSPSCFVDSSASGLSSFGWSFESSAESSEDPLSGPSSSWPVFELIQHGEARRCVGLSQPTPPMEEFEYWRCRALREEAAAHNSNAPDGVATREVRRSAKGPFFP